VAEVSQLSRNTQGVTLIKLPADEALVSVVRLDAEEESEGSGAEALDTDGGSVEAGEVVPGSNDAVEDGAGESGTDDSEPEA